ncbi:MAG: HAD family hydrolase [Prochlorothrix sp.]
MLTAILFDLDGTLANTDPIHYQVWADLLQAFSITLTPEFYNSHISGRKNRDLMVDLFPDWPVHKIDQFSDYKEELFREQAAAKLAPVPGLLDFLDWIEAQGLRRGVVTNAPRANAEFMLATLGLSDRFETLVIGEEATAAKPDPAPYLLGLKNLGQDPANRAKTEQNVVTAIAFEDSRTGVQSASRAGLYTVGLTTTHGAAELEKAGAVVTLPDFQSVLELSPIQDFLAYTQQS